MATTFVVPRVRTSQRHRRSSRVVAYTGMSVLAVLFMFPFFWTAASSLKAASDVYIYPPIWIPAVLRWDNYPQVFQLVPYATWFGNTVVVVVLQTLGVVVSASLVAYSLARFRYPGRDLLFLLTLGTMMLPAEVTLIPTYLLFKNLDWLNTLKPLWVPAWFGGGAFNIFLLRQFLLALPRELDEAAIVDGASYARILGSVLLPLMKPVLATVAVINFIFGWNDFLGPLVYLTSPENFTLAVGLRYFDVTPNQPGVPQLHLLMAAVVMGTLPIIALFFAAQRYFVEGVVLSGIKG
jgi:multiple sugar transport system permease protein